MSESPHLHSLPAFFGNNSPFPPPASTPRVPSAKFLSSPSAPPLPPARDVALERERMLRQQEMKQQQQIRPEMASLGTGLRPGQLIPSTAVYPAGPSRFVSSPNPSSPAANFPGHLHSPRPILSPRRSSPFVPSHQQHQHQQPHPRPQPLQHHYPPAPPPPIQRPATTEPARGSHNTRTPMTAATATMDAIHLSTPPRMPAASEGRRRVNSEDHLRTNEQLLRDFVQDEPSPSPPSASTLNVALPDLAGLEAIRKSAYASGNVKRKIAWCKDVIKYVERKSEGNKISDPLLVQFIDEAIDLINRSATSSPPVPEALFLRGDLLASGAFPSYHRKNLKQAFNDFELSARMGYAPSWFRIGRDYETLGDNGRAKDAYERGRAVKDVGCIYRMGMANLLGQLDLPKTHDKAIPLLREAADLANLDTPQPSYIYGMLLAGEFSHIEVSQRLLVAVPDPHRPGEVPTLEGEARRRIQKAAYLNFGPAQYRCGWSYEYAQLECNFDPLLSVQYYSLASQGGEVEADLALSKWFLCGAEGYFDKNESLAFTFAEKAARKGLPSGEFAMGYYFEVGVGCEKNINIARDWYSKAAGHGNADAKERLIALEGPTPMTMSRVEHESHIDTQLQRKRTEAKMKSDRRSQAAALAKDWRNGGGQSNGAPVPGHAQTAKPKPSTQPAVPSMDIRRKATMKMVEETARRNYRGPRKAEQNEGNSGSWEIRGENSAAASGPAQRPRLSTPLKQTTTNVNGPARLASPAPASPHGSKPPPPQSPVRGGGRYDARASPAPSPGRNPATKNKEMHAVKAPSKVVDKPATSYETFGEMGFTPKKARDDKDCVIC